MSFMNKVKDAISGSHNSGRRNSVNNPTDESRGFGPSSTENKGVGSNQTSDSSKSPESYPATGGYGQNTQLDSQDSAGLGANNNSYNPTNRDTGVYHDSSHATGGNYNSNDKGLGSQSERYMKSGDYKSSTQDSAFNSNERTTGAQLNRKKGAMDLSSSNRDTAGFPSNTPGSNMRSTMDTPSSNVAGYGASNLNTGSHDSGGTTMGTQAMRKQNEDSGPNYRPSGDNRASGTNNQDSFIDNTQDRAESDINNRTGQQAFGGGAAAGGSSQGQPELGRRRSSGPHSFNLLNKLDPRVRSSDYEKHTVGNQRGS